MRANRAVYGRGHDVPGAGLLQRYYAWLGRKAMARRQADPELTENAQRQLVLCAVLPHLRFLPRSPAQDRTDVLEARSAEREELFRDPPPVRSPTPVATLDDRAHPPLPPEQVLPVAASRRGLGW
jgi:hypothetical protein